MKLSLLRLWRLSETWQVVLFRVLSPAMKGWLKIPALQLKIWIELQVCKHPHSSCIVVQDMLVHSLGGDSGREIMRLQGRLCAEEAALFEAGRSAVTELQQWRGSRVRQQCMLELPESADGPVVLSHAAMWQAWLSRHPRHLGTRDQHAGGCEVCVDCLGSLDQQEDVYFGGLSLLGICARVSIGVPFRLPTLGTCDVACNVHDCAAVW